MSTKANSPGTYTIAQAAQRLGVSRNHAYGAARRGEIPIIRVGKRLLVPKARLDAMLGISGEAA